MTSENLAFVSLAVSTTVAFVGALVRTLYQKDSEAQKEAIVALKLEIEALKRHDSALSDRVHSQENQLTKIFVVLGNIEGKLDSIIRKRDDLQ